MGFEMKKIYGDINVLIHVKLIIFLHIYTIVNIIKSER